jgi:hypothetical protein
MQVIKLIWQRWGPYLIKSTLGSHCKWSFVSCGKCRLKVTGTFITYAFWLKGANTTDKISP